VATGPPRSRTIRSRTRGTAERGKGGSSVDFGFVRGHKHRILREPRRNADQMVADLGLNPIP